MADADWLKSYPEATALEVALASEDVSPQVAQIARSVYQQESSSGKNTTTSNAGAVGGMQIVPNTFKRVADPGWDINDPVHNARAGVRYLAQLHERGGGDPKLTAAGYYGGEGGQDKARAGIAVRDRRNPNAPDTLQYAEQVTKRLPKEAAGAKDLSWLEAYPEAPPTAAAPEAQKPLPAGVTPSKAGAGRGSINPPAAAALPKRSTLSELGRQLGLTVRAGVKGVASLPAMAADAVIVGPANAALGAADSDYRLPRQEEQLDRVLTAVGLPEPENATERVVQDVASGMAGAGTFVQAGKVLAKSAAPVTAAVGEKLAEGAGLQVVSGASGAGAASLTRENGGGAGSQVVAGLAGALAPGVAPYAGRAAVRGVLRGGEAGRQRVAENLKTFEAAGTVPTVAQASEGRIARATESLLAKTPGSAGIIAQKAQQQADEMAAAVQSLSDQLAPGASAVNAGEAIARGVKAFKDGFKTVQEHLYSNLDQHIPQGTPIGVGNTEFALKALNEDIAGAPNLSAWFKNSKMQGIDKALQADLELAQTTGKLPYEAIKKLRTLVGREIADNSLVSDVPRSKWNALYGALSEDLGEAAKKAGPQAEQAWGWANKFTSSQLERLDQLSGIVSKDAPEKMFVAAISGTAEGDTVVKRVINALPKQERRELAAAVLQRLGRATPGQQNAVGDAFASETFLTNLSKLSPAARATIFGRTGVPGLQEAVDKFAKVSALRREGGKVFANPSGTAPAAAQLGMAGGIGGALTIFVTTGNVVPLALALGAPAIANAAARKVSSPQFVRGLGEAAELGAGTAAAAVSAASRAHGEPQPEHAWLEQFPLADPVAVSAPITGPAAPQPAEMQQPIDAGAPQTEPPPAADMFAAPEPEQLPGGTTPAVAPEGEMPLRADPAAQPASTVQTAPLPSPFGGAMPQEQSTEVPPEPAPAATAPAAPIAAASPHATPQPLPEALPAVAAQAQPEPAAARTVADRVKSVYDTAVQEERAQKAAALQERLKALRATGEGDHVLNAIEWREQRADELGSFAAAGHPLLASPEFARAYGQQRLTGARPGDAAARAATTLAFTVAGQQAGLPRDVLSKALDVAGKVPPAKAPQFFAKFVDGLARGGVIQPEAAQQVAQTIHDAWDAALESTVAFYAPPQEAQPAEAGHAEEVTAAAKPTPQTEDPQAAAVDVAAAPGGESAQLDAGSGEAGADGGGGAVAVSEDSEFTPKTLSDGTLLLNGDGAAIHAMLREAGFPDSSLQASAGGVLVGRTQAARVREAIGRMEQVAEIDQRAHQAATSPLNERPEPTEAQKRAGNYKLGHIRMHGLDISIENPKGSVRRGVAPDGSPWESELASHYGYIAKSKGADNDHVDVFVGPSPGSHRVFVVDQLNADRGFDEHKIMLAYNSLDDAREGYLANYEPGWQGLGAITELPLAAFKSWVKDGTKRKPLGDIRSEETA